MKDARPPKPLTPPPHRDVILAAIAALRGMHRNDVPGQAREPWRVDVDIQHDVKNSDREARRLRLLRTSPSALKPLKPLK